MIARTLETNVDRLLHRMEHNRRAMILLGLAIAFFLALMLLAVNSNDDASEGGATDLYRTSWTVESLGVDGGQLTIEAAGGEQIMYGSG